MITASERAGHAIRVKSAKLVEAIVAEQYRMQPDLADRYGDRGRWYCTRDVGYHVDALAASVEVGASTGFVEYVRWTMGVLAAYGIPESDMIVTLQAMRSAVLEIVAPPVAETACRHLDAALAQYPKSAS